MCTFPCSYTNEKYNKACPIVMKRVSYLQLFLNVQS